MGGAFADAGPAGLGAAVPPADGGNDAVGDRVDVGPGAGVRVGPGGIGVGLDGGVGFVFGPSIVNGTVASLPAWTLALRSLTCTSRVWAPGGASFGVKMSTFAPQSPFPGYGCGVRFAVARFCVASQDTFTT
jgi:hypothetical protein